MTLKRRTFLTYCSAIVASLFANDLLIRKSRAPAPVSMDTSGRPTSRTPDSHGVSANGPVDSPMTEVVSLDGKQPIHRVKGRKNTNRQPSVRVVESKPGYNSPHHSERELQNEHSDSFDDGNSMHFASRAERHPDSNALDNLGEAPSQTLSAADTPDKQLDGNQKIVVEQLVDRLTRLQAFVGYGNFNIIGFDQSLRFARNHSQIGALGKAELDLIEQVFSDNATTLGFYGDKVVTQLTSTIDKNDVRKIPKTGHYLFRGDALIIYDKIRGDIGESIILTSGIRSVVKQVYLFLSKVLEVDGNLSVASYSLAPPGHSYHAVGDFDVGKTGFGKQNFTAAFSDTEEFKRLSDLGYIDIRYPQNNPFGVRYEPWHIKVV